MKVESIERLSDLLNQTLGVTGFVLLCLAAIGLVMDYISLGFSWKLDKYCEYIKPLFGRLCGHR